jgi:hypothetical protein
MQQQPAAALAVPASEAHRRLLDDGYLIIENAAPAATFARVDAELAPHFAAAPFGTGAFYGPETKRFGRALSRSAALAELVLEETIFGLVGQVLGSNCDTLQLNLTQGIEIHPGAPAQGPHRDADMWWLPRGQMECMVNVMWALDDFTFDNGATRIWPQSNRMHLDQALLPDDMAVPAVMPRGSACLILGSTMHSGGANLSSAPRRGLVVSYCLGWLKPWENQWLAYPPEVARMFPPELAALVGYRQHRPSLGNFEGQCPSALLQGDGSGAGTWTDTLMPEQGALADQYREMQLAMRQAA